MKPLVIYHANCTDGFGAAFAAWLKLGDEAEYLPMEYSPLSHKHIFCHDREVYILDFSFPKPVMDAIFQRAKRVVWLDHHASVFKDWGASPDRVQTEKDIGIVQAAHIVTLDNNKSGAMLAWEYFHPGAGVPMLIQHIDDRDRWQFKLDGTKELHAALASYQPWTFEQWWRLFYDKPGLGTYKRADLIQEGTAILRAHNQHVQAALKQARICTVSFKEQPPGVLQRTNLS